MTVFRAFAFARSHARLIISSTSRFNVSGKSPATLKSPTSSLIFVLTMIMMLGSSLRR